MSLSRMGHPHQIDCKSAKLFPPQSLVEITDGVAVVGTTRPYARDWIENRLANKIGWALRVQTVRCVVVSETNLP
jgi:hypothetical protein